MVRGEKDCVLVDEGTGAVLARAVPIEDEANPPQCSVQIVARKDQYDTFKSDPVSIDLERGTMGTLTAPVYGSGITATLPLVGSVGILHLPTEQNDLPAVPVNFTATGTDGSNAKSDVCEVADDGRVTAGSAATDGDQCKIVVTMEAPGYEPSDAPEVTLTVVEGAFHFDGPPVISFVGELKVGGLTDANDSGESGGTNYLDFSGIPEEYVPTDGTGNVTITWHYQVRSLDAHGDEDEDPVCELVEDSEDANKKRILVDFSAQVGGYCLIKAVAEATDYAEYETPELAIAFAPGDLFFEEKLPEQECLHRNLESGRSPCCAKQ